MADLSQATWRKSTRSCADGCVEVAMGDRQVAVRDSKDQTGAKLIFTLAEWDAFLNGVREGEFDVFRSGAKADEHPYVGQEGTFPREGDQTGQATWISQTKSAIRNGIGLPGWIPWTLAPINVAAQMADTPTANILVINLCALVSQAMAIKGLLLLERIRFQHAERMQKLELDKLHAREDKRHS